MRIKRANSHDLTAYLQFKLHFNQEITVKYWPKKGWYAYPEDPQELPTWIGNIWSDAIEYIKNLPDEPTEALYELSLSALIEYCASSDPHF